MISMIRFARGETAWIGGKAPADYLAGGNAVLTFEGINRVLKPAMRTRVNNAHVAYVREHDAETIEEAHRIDCER